MQPDIDYVKIGQRIRSARLEKKLSQADLGMLVGCSNNHMSHLEIGQTKVSLSMLIKLARVLDKEFDFFLLDTPYAGNTKLINGEISEKLGKCTTATLVTVNKILDILLEQQSMLEKENHQWDNHSHK